jgi:hypothetical protein
MTNSQLNFWVCLWGVRMMESIRSFWWLRERMIWVILPPLVTLDIRGLVVRWVRGFHAALYNEYIPREGNFATLHPFPEVKYTSDVGFQVMPTQKAFAQFALEIKRNRQLQNLDRIVCRNGVYGVHF